MPEPAAKPGFNRFLKIGIPLLVSALAIWLVLRQLDLQAVGDAFRQLSPTSIALIMLCFSVGALLRGLVCWILLGGKLSYSNVFWGMNLGYLLNTIVPLRLGEFGRAAFLTERGKQKISYMEVFASIVGERLLDLLVGFTYLLFCLFFLIENATLNRIAGVGIVVLVLSIIIIFYATRNREKVLLWLSRRFSSSQLMTKKMIPWIEQLLTGFQYFAKPGRFLLAFSILAVSWSFSMLEYLILQNAILPTKVWWWPMLVNTASAFINALPSAPGGLGVFEAGTVGAYALVGVGKAPALAIALVVHSVQIVIPAILGVIALIISGQSLGSLIDKATKIRQKEEKAS